MYLINLCIFYHKLVHEDFKYLGNGSDRYFLELTHYFLTHGEIFNPFLLRRNQEVDLHKQGLKTVQDWIFK